jgi:hypothetical protein
MNTPFIDSPPITAVVFQSLDTAILPDTTMVAESYTNHLLTDELSYSLSRRYPFGRAFKWWVLGAFTCLMTFFTVFNLAVNGFDKDFKYTTDPNTTVVTTHWYNNSIHLGL